MTPIEKILLLFIPAMKGEVKLEYKDPTSGWKKLTYNEDHCNFSIDDRDGYSWGISSLLKWGHEIRIVKQIDERPETK